MSMPPVVATIWLLRRPEPSTSTKLGRASRVAPIEYIPGSSLIRYGVAAVAAPAGIVPDAAQPSLAGVPPRTSSSAWPERVAFSAGVASVVHGETTIVRR